MLNRNGLGRIVVDTSILQNRNVKIGLIGLGICLLIYLAIGSWLSKINYSQKSIHSYWTVVKQSCDRRVQMLPQFFQVIQHAAPEAQIIQQKISKAYEPVATNQFSETMLSNPIQVHEFLSWQKEVVMALSFMQAQEPAYPALAQNRQYLMLKMELKNLELQLALSVKGLNRDIRYFNSLIIGFPQGWANMLYPREKPKMPLEGLIVEEAPQK